MRYPTKYYPIMICVLLCASLGFGQQPITLFLAGDSTMAEKLPSKRPETGWGEFVQSAFNENQVRVENHAKNGRSTRTFISDGLWQEIIDRLHRGDYVFIEFGHNDESKEKTDRYVTPEAFRANLVRMVEDVKAKQAYPVLLTPIARRRFDHAGNFFDAHPPEYPEAVRVVAAKEKVPLLDMLAASSAVLKKYGETDSRTLFLQLKPGENPNYPNGVEDNTHFNPVGARLMCDLAIKAIRERNLPLAKFLRKE